MDFFIISIILAGASKAYKETKEELDRLNSDEFFKENAWKFGIDPNSREKDARNGDD